MCALTPISRALCLAALLAQGLVVHAVRATESATDLDEWVVEGRWKRGANSVESTSAKQFGLAKRMEGIGDVNQAAEAYKRLAYAYPESDEAEESLVLASKNFLAGGKFLKSLEMLNELRRRYVNPTFLDAMGRVEAELGRGYLEGRGIGGTFKVASRLRKARRIFDQILKQDPQGRWADDALLGLGQCFEVEAKYSDAIKEYKKLLEKYPRSELRAEAEGRIAICITRREPSPDYTETETREALDRIKDAKNEAGGGTVDVAALEDNQRLLENRQAQKRYDQARFYVINGHYRAAEIYYELIIDRYPASPWAKKAKEALVRMRKR